MTAFWLVSLPLAISFFPKYTLMFAVETTNWTVAVIAVVRAQPLAVHAVEVHHARGNAAGAAVGILHYPLAPGVVAIGHRVARTIRGAGEHQPVLHVPGVLQQFDPSQLPLASAGVTWLVANSPARKPAARCPGRDFA